MNKPTEQVTIAFRIPGPWSNPGALMERLPPDHRMTEDALFLPDGTEIGLGAGRPDDQFPRIFRSSCRDAATDEEMAIVDNYAVNVFLMGPGGSMEAALKMMEAAAAIIYAGGAGVFIDNCGLAHGGENWLAMTDDGGSDALSYAYVAIVRGKTEVWTMGLHALGLRDVVMKRADAEAKGLDVVEIVRYLARSDRPVEDGHVLADLGGLRFQAFAQDSDPRFVGSPMHNPFGRLKLVSMGDIAASN